MLTSLCRQSLMTIMVRGVVIPAEGGVAKTADPGVV